MGYRELAVKIKNGYSSLKREPVFKCLDIIWNQKLKTAEISVVNDAEFKIEIRILYVPFSICEYTLRVISKFRSCSFVATCS